MSDASSLPASEYAYLLGVYLGDGHIVLCRREVYRLMIACDASYPGLVRATADAVQAVFRGTACAWCAIRCTVA